MNVKDYGFMRINHSEVMLELSEYIEHPVMLSTSEADVEYIAQLEVEVGKSYLIELDMDIMEVLDCYATVNDKIFFDCGIIKYNKKMDDDIFESIDNKETEMTRRFVRLLTSECIDKRGNESQYAKLGYQSKVSVNILARLYDKDKCFTIWEEFIKYGLKHMKERKYDLSILFSGIGFESYIDHTLHELFDRKCLDENSIETILKKINSMDAKVYSLLPSLSGINTKEIPDIKYWKNNILKTRNLIAHGLKEKCTYEDAIRTHRFVVNAIKYIDNNISYKIK